MNELLASVRAVHFAATMWLFGELVLACVILDRRSGEEHATPGALLRRRLPWVARVSIAVGLGSALVWLAAMAATMSGLPLSKAIGLSTLGAVVGNTLFGKIWITRLGLAVALLLLVGSRNPARSGWRLASGALLAAAYLGALAWTGHAAAAEGPSRNAQLASDVMHLLAAGAWLGALPSLAYLLGAVQSIELEQAARATRRFSAVAIPCVGALILTGIGNSWFLVGSVPALFGTRYGALLLAKLALLALMLGLAAVNRQVLTPRLAAGDRHALRALRRNTLLEIAAGVLVVAIVGVLGISVPAAHQSPLWPFSHTLSLAAARESPATLGSLVAAALVFATGFAFALAGARRRAWPLIAAGLIGIAAAPLWAAWLIAVPAYPTTYATSPVRYSTVAVVDGARLFAAHCVACHGDDRTGGGPRAVGLDVRPANLALHAARHRLGELYWWIAHGRAGTAMPAFAPTLGSNHIWSIVQFLHALSDAASLVELDGELIATRPQLAPDFSYELPGRGQQSLLQQDEPRETLLVVYSLPDSLPRLRSLASEYRAFEDGSVRVLAVGSNAADVQRASVQTPAGEPMLAISTPDVAAAYAILAGSGRVATVRHAEFLIDRRGRLRTCWIGATVPAVRKILDAADQLDRALLLPPPPHEHEH